MTRYTPEWLDRLVEDAPMEDERLEFKRTPPDDWNFLKDEQRRDSRRIEFLKDVTALANHRGGLILYGAEEEKTEGSSAARLRRAHGFSTWSQGDKALAERRVADIHRLCKERIHPPLDVRPTPIEREDGNIVLALEVPEGPNKPYMVQFNDQIAFVRRRGADKFTMDYSEIRDMMFATASRHDQIKSWRTQRLEAIRRHDLPFPAGEDSNYKVVPYLAYVIVPLSQWGRMRSFDTTFEAVNPLRLLMPELWVSCREGAYERLDSTPDDVLALREHAALEFVRAHHLFEVGSTFPKVKKRVDPYRISLNILESIADSVSFYRHFFSSPQTAVMVSLHNAQGLLVTQPYYEVTLTQKHLVMPEYTLEIDYDAPLDGERIEQAARELVRWIYAMCQQEDTSDVHEELIQALDGYISAHQRALKGPSPRRAGS